MCGAPRTVGCRAPGARPASASRDRLAPSALAARGIRKGCHRWGRRCPALVRLGVSAARAHPHRSDRARAPLALRRARERRPGPPRLGATRRGTSRRGRLTLRRDHTPPRPARANDPLGRRRGLLADTTVVAPRARVRRRHPIRPQRRRGAREEAARAAPRGTRRGRAPLAHRRHRLRCAVDRGTCDRGTRGHRPHGARPHRASRRPRARGALRSRHGGVRRCTVGGFWVPALEALARGTAVLVPSGSPQAVTAGPHAIPFDAEDIAALARRLDELSYRPPNKEACDARHAFAATFTWTRTADELVSLWRSLCAAPRERAR
jgi:hypothetical protein